MTAFVSSGVWGLDHVLRGGFLEGGFYLVQGDPGSGKTTLALQYALAHVKQGRRCLYVTLTESVRDLQRNCDAHGWSLVGLDVCDLTRSGATERGEALASIFHPADTELGDVISAVMAAVKRTQPQHLVFDGLSELRLMTGDPLRYRRQLIALKEAFAAIGATVLLLDDRSAPFEGVQPESLVGGNIVLERVLPPYGRARRRMFVTKVRGADFREGYHDYEIVAEGVVIHPRLVAAEHREPSPIHLIPSGVANLDLMLKGGLHTGTTTLFLGPAGCGKSTVCMQFVVNALKAGRKAAVYAFDEVVATLVDRSEKLCLVKSGGFQSFVDAGLLHLQQVDPAEMSPGAFSQEVCRAVEAGAQIVVIDSLNGYLNAMPEERFLVAHLHELFVYLNQRGILTVIVMAQHGMTMGPSPLTDIDVSYLADAVLLFRYFESRGEILQAVSVFKKRTGSHERTIHQLSINEKGVHVGQPLYGLHGIMTGVPKFDDKDGLVIHTVAAGVRDGDWHERE